MLSLTFVRRPRTEPCGYSSNFNVDGGKLYRVAKKLEPGQSHEDKKVQKLVERIKKKQAPKEQSIPGQEDKPKQ